MVRKTKEILLYVNLYLKDKKLWNGLPQGHQDQALRVARHVDKGVH